MCTLELLCTVMSYRVQMNTVLSIPSIPSIPTIPKGLEFHFDGHSDCRIVLIAFLCFWKCLLQLVKNNWTTTVYNILQSQQFEIFGSHTNTFCGDVTKS